MSVDSYATLWEKVVDIGSDNSVAEEIVMIQMSQLQREIDALPEEAKDLLLDFLVLLKRRYLTDLESTPQTVVSNYEKFEKIGLIGCCDVEQDLSVNYKAVLAESLEAKYDLEAENDHC